MAKKILKKAQTGFSVSVPTRSGNPATYSKSKTNSVIVPSDKARPLDIDTNNISYKTEVVKSRVNPNRDTNKVTTKTKTVSPDGKLTKTKEKTENGVTTSSNSKTREISSRRAERIKQRVYNDNTRDYYFPDKYPGEKLKRGGTIKKITPKKKK